MSLLDDVSVVVTPNGYKAGELYAVVPVPSEGAELLTNGDFASDLTGWTGYGTTSATGGVATIGASANSGIYQDILTEGVRYTVTVNVTSYDGVGTAEFVNGNGNNLYTITETGIQTFTFTHNIAASSLILRGMSNALFSVSSVSVKEYTASDMDVTRATAATRVDENGLVNYAEIKGSEIIANGDFATDSDWTFQSSWSISGGKANYDAVTTQHFLKQTISPSIAAGKIIKIQFDILDVQAGKDAFFKLEIDGSPESVFTYTKFSEGEYTYYHTITSGLDRLNFVPLNTSTGGAFSIDNVSVKEVTRNNVPRIDYTGGGCPHILAEPQRTNLVTYSEDFSQSLYSIVRATRTSQSAISPSGLNDAYKLESTTTGNSGSWINATVTSYSGVHTISIYAKKGTTEFLLITEVYPNGAVFNLDSGTVKQVSSGEVAAIENVGNGWYRCSYTFTASSSTKAYFIVGNSNTTVTLHSATDGNNIFIYGSQLEEGSYPTSYIPTSGSTVTRNKDVFSRDGISSLINSTQGCLFGEINFVESNSSSYNYPVSLSDGTTNNRIEIRQTGANVQFLWRVSGTYQSQISTSGVDVGNNFKFALNYSSANIKFYVNGNLIGTLNSPTLYSANTLNRLAFDDGGGGNCFYGNMKQLQVYKTALTDAQLISLTS